MTKKKIGRSNNQMQRSENAEDLISQLPKDVIETILELVPIEVAVRTSVLSKKWRYHWTSIRKLTFDESFLEIFEEMEEETPYYKHAEIVHNILMQHRGSLDTFFIRVQSYNGNYECGKTKDLYERSLHLVSNKGVKDCTISNGEEYEAWDNGEGVYVKAFPSLFSCSEITRLAVENFVFSLPPTFGGFANLVTLEFTSVLFCGESLQFMTSTSPRLQYLTLNYCRGPSTGDDGSSTLNVSSSNLKHLKVTLISAIRINIDTRILETLSVELHSGNSPCYIIPLTKLDCLKSLEIGDLHPANLQMLVCLFRSAPNLLELKIQLFLLSCLFYLEEVVMFLKASNSQVMLKHLKLLKIDLWDYSEGELLLLKVLLAGTPALEKIDVVRRWKEGSISKLVQYPRASPMAKLVSDGVAIDW